MNEIPNYPRPDQAKRVDPVARSMAKPDACAKPCTIGKGVRVRVNLKGDKTLRRSRRKRPHDKRDVAFY